MLTETQNAAVWAGIFAAFVTVGVASALGWPAVGVVLAVPVWLIVYGRLRGHDAPAHGTVDPPLSAESTEP
jgi:hypothetical protein